MPALPSVTHMANRATSNSAGFYQLQGGEDELMKNLQSLTNSTHSQDTRCLKGRPVREETCTFTCDCHGILPGYVWPSSPRSSSDLNLENLVNIWLVPRLIPIMSVQHHCRSVKNVSERPRSGPHDVRCSRKEVRPKFVATG